MKNLLKTLFSKAIILGDFEFSETDIDKNWIGRNPVSKMEIEQTEKRLGQQLPDDYKDLLLLTNGFEQLTIVEPSFAELDEIDWLKNIDPELIEIYADSPDEYDKLNRSIVVGGINEEQHFLIIPPSNAKIRWTYWRFASWDPTGEFYSGLKEYFKDVIKFISEEIEN